MRTLDQRLSLAVMAFLDAHKEGTAFESVEIVSANGTNLVDEIAGITPVTEPELPFIAIGSDLTPDDELDGVYDSTLVIHLKTDGESPDASRLVTERIKQDLLSVFSQPVDLEEYVSDSNPLFGLFFEFANAPDELPDDRLEVLKPIHVYNVRHETSPVAFMENVWHDQHQFTVTLQQWDSHELEDDEI
jgi:hypothetical protein